jgi:CDP-glucose 4,6-dehydratase
MPTLNQMHKRNRKFWLDRPVLVTGGTGLLGSWLVPTLVELDAQVVCLVRDWVPQSKLVLSDDIKKVVLVRGDICDQALLERTLGEYEVKTVLHLAAQTVVGTANRNPVGTLDTNIRGTWIMLEACRRSPTVEQVIVASSDKAYGDQEKLPYSEDTPLQGQHPYDVSKSCADLIAMMYYHTFGLSVCVTRCGNFYGGGDLNWNRIVPGTIRSVLRDERPIVRSDGRSIRDYFYVEDAVLAYLHLAERMNEPAVKGQAFNFSNEIQVTVLDVTLKILYLMGRDDLQPEVLNIATNEIRHQYLSAEKARRILSWTPQFTLEEGLRRTIEWYRKHLKV